MKCKKCGGERFEPTIYPTGAHCSKCGKALSEKDFKKLCDNGIVKELFDNVKGYYGSKNG